MPIKNNITLALCALSIINTAPAMELYCPLDTTDTTITSVLSYVLPLDIPKHQLSDTETETINNRKTNIENELSHADPETLDFFVRLCPILFSQHHNFEEYKEKILHDANVEKSCRKKKYFELEKNFNLLKSVYETLNELLDSSKEIFLEELKINIKPHQSVEEKDDVVFDLKLTYPSKKSQAILEASEVLHKQLEEIIKEEKPTYSKENIYKTLSVNLMWIYNSIHNGEKYIFPNPYYREHNINVFERIKEWATTYQAVNFWYDSRTLAPTKEEIQQKIQRTQEKIHKVLGKLGECVHLRDVRDLEIVKQNPQAFNGSIYFTSDLLRVVASYETLKQSQNGTFFLYGDLSLDPKNFSSDFVLSSTTVSDLNNYGFIVAKHYGVRVYENQLHIMGNNKHHLLQAVKVAIIDLNIKRATDESNSELYKYFRSSFGDQVVYDSYPTMFDVFYALEGLATIHDEAWKNVDKDNEETLRQYFDLISEGLKDSVGPKIVTISDKKLELQSKIRESSRGKTGFIPTIDGEFPWSSHG